MRLVPNRPGFRVGAAGEGLFFFGGGESTVEVLLASVKIRSYVILVV